MRTHRFIGDFDFSGHVVEIGNERMVRQITRVLRLKTGTDVILGDGKGREYTAEIKKIDPKKIYLLIRKENGSATETGKNQVLLYCAILKRENFELVVQKATEIGVTEIVPVLTERTVKKRVRTDRLADIAREASEQSGRRFIPKIREPIPFSQALDEIEKGDIAILYDPSGALLPGDMPMTPERIRIFIGPEDGWSEKEKTEARAKNCICARLGTRTLRAETAAIVGLYLIMHSHGSKNHVE